MAEGRAGAKPGRRPARVGLEEVARHAGVGIATVGRVLNERGNVSPETARRVIQAARELGLKRILPLPHRRMLRFEALIARPHPSFLPRLNHGFASLAATLDRSVLVQRTTLPNAEPARVAERIRATKADGLIILADEHADVRDAIAAVTLAGMPVVCMVTDIPDSGRIAYVGINNEKAGRTAGLLAARLSRRPGPAVVLTGNLGLRAHAERLAGFRAALQHEAPETRVAAVLEGRDEDDRVARLLGKALRDNPDTVAIYNTGGCLTVVATAIRKTKARNEIVFIGHELTAETRTLLRDGDMSLTMDQAFELQARRAVEVLLRHVGHIDTLPGPVEIPFTLHTRENA